MSKGGSQLFNIFCPRESKHSTWERVATPKKKLNKANIFSSTKMKSMFSWEETKQEFFSGNWNSSFCVCLSREKREKERNNLQVSQKTIFLCFCDSSIWSRRARISSKRCTKVKRTRNKTSLSTYCDGTLFSFRRRNFLCQEWSYYFFGVKCFVTIMFLKTNQDNSIKKLSRWTIIEFNRLSCCFCFWQSHQHSASFSLTQ